ncbi:MAG: monofunctional biosynthetic peptidoglycan transglycosylase [Acidobacteriota bacterium]
MFRKLVLGILVALLAFVVWEWATFPDVSKLAEHAPDSTAFMELRRQQLRAAGKSDELSYQFVPYGSISPYLRRAVLVAEDDTFYEHEGVDVKGLEEALQKDWQRKQITHGGSTITQQLAKNLYLSPSRNPLRKAKEYFIARSLERHLTKKRILELYLNVVEMGERVYGAEAASRAYFGRGAGALTPQQAALLAGCLPNPRIMSPAAPNKRLRWRQRMILSRMRRWGYLLEREVLTAKKPVVAPVTPERTDTDLAPPPPPTETSTGTAPDPALPSDATVHGQVTPEPPPAPTATVPAPVPASASATST